MAAKRKAISLETKKSIIEDSQIGIKNSELCRKYNVERTTVTMIIKNKQNILSAIEKGASSNRARLYKHSDLDEALLEWIKLQNSKNIQFNGPMLKKKALEISKQLYGNKVNKFVASNGWLVRFRTPHSIKLNATNMNENKSTTINVDNSKETEGFAYTRHRLSVDGRRTYWRCERRSSLNGCHGRAVTVGTDEGQPVVLTVHHNHPPSEKYGPLTGGTGTHGWAVGGDIVGAANSVSTNLRGDPFIPKVSRCDIPLNRKRCFDNLPLAFSSLPPFIGDGDFKDPPNLSLAEGPSSPQHSSSYSTMEQFLQSHADNVLPPFLESAEDGVNETKRQRLEETDNGAELGDLYSTEGFFDPKNENGINGDGIQLDQLKKEWEDLTSYSPSHPSTSSTVLATTCQQSVNTIDNLSSIKMTSNSSFGGTALIKEKSQLDFLLPLTTTESEQGIKGFLGGKQCGTSSNGFKQMPNLLEWENDPRTIELRKQLNEALDRERTFQHKTQKTADELLDARAEIDVIKAKNERLEKRIKNLNDELSNLREQLDQSMDHCETLERQQIELNLKESRKRGELQRELEAKEDEMEEMRIQFQRKIRNLESALDDAQLENSSLLKQKKAWQLNSQSDSINGSLLDLTTNTTSVNRSLKRKLAKALSLLQSSQINYDKDLIDLNTQLRTSKQNLGSNVLLSSVCGGSELDELDNILMEENVEELEKSDNILKQNDQESVDDSLLQAEKTEQFDGANSDTIENSSCGADEIMPSCSNNI